jgi:hypothetical protein
MPSPFPGMDPYLEAPAGWQEFHHIFIAGIDEATFLSQKFVPSMPFTLNAMSMSLKFSARRAESDLM